VAQQREPEWVNPYQITKRGAETLTLIAEYQMLARLKPGTEPGSDPVREWAFSGGPPGSWSQQARDWAARFLEVGLIDHARRPPGDDWSLVHLTRAGKFLLHAWHTHPFTVDNESPGRHHTRIPTSAPSRKDTPVVMTDNTPAPPASAAVDLGVTTKHSVLCRQPGTGDPVVIGPFHKSTTAEQIAREANAAGLLDVEVATHVSVAEFRDRPAPRDGAAHHG
jgi:hypothetical protein